MTAPSDSLYSGASNGAPAPAQATPAGSEAPPTFALLNMMTGYWVSQAIHVSAKLGIADLLADGAVSCEELAVATETHAPSLGRVLRALASVGVFAETSGGRFCLTPVGDLLRTDAPDSLRALAILWGGEQYRAWFEIAYSVRTGKPAFEHMYGMGLFEYYGRNPEAGAIFNEAMTNWTAQVARSVVSTYDFSRFGTVIDVGGGYGTLLAAILKSCATVRGVLLDQPQVIDRAVAQLRASGLADRCTVISGDFFTAVPPAGDVYVLSQILHDWDDERCLAILRQCRRAIPAHGKLLVLELVLPPGNEPFVGKWLDLHMLVLAGGRERTVAEHEVLLHAAGFAQTRLVPTPLGPSIIEAAPTDN